MRVNYHGLSDFRSGHGELPGGLLSEQVAALLASGMASLDEVAVDGTKVRASAGSGSFRAEGGLSRYEAAAWVRIAALRSELESDSGAASCPGGAGPGCARYGGEGFGGAFAA